MLAGIVIIIFVLRLEESNKGKIAIKLKKGSPPQLPNPLTPCLRSRSVSTAIFLRQT